MFYKVTPAVGPVEIGRITSGFLVNREQRGPGKDGTGVAMRLAVDAGIDREDLKPGAEVEVTTHARTTRYSIVELLPMQQLGTGYILRLRPLQGATG